MNAEIITHCREERAASEKPSPVVGMVHVLLEGKIKVWMQCLKSKMGFYYLKFPNTRIRGEWMPVMEYVERDLAREISTQLKDELHRIYP